MTTNIKIIAIIISLIVTGTGGYIYMNRPQEQSPVEQTPTGFGMQPVVQPGTIDSPDARSFSADDLNKLRRHHK